MTASCEHVVQSPYGIAIAGRATCGFDPCPWCRIKELEGKLEALSGKLRPLTCVKHTWSSEEECPYCFNAELKSRLDSATRIVRNLVDWSTPKRLKGFTILTAIVKDAEQFLGVAPAWQAEESRIALEHGETEDSVVETPCCRGLAPASECKCERERVVEIGSNNS